MTAFADSTSSTEQISRTIVDELFAISDTDNPEDRCQRIALKGGEWPDKETELCGFVKSSLTTWLTERLEKYRRPASKFRNKNSGKIYQQICISNSTATQKTWLMTMVYQDIETGEVWSQRLDEFLKKNTQIVDSVIGGES